MATGPYAIFHVIWAMDLSLLACLVYVNGPWPVWYGCPLAYGPMAVVLSYGYGLWLWLIIVELLVDPLDTGPHKHDPRVFAL